MFQYSPAGLIQNKITCATSEHPRVRHMLASERKCQRTCARISGPAAQESMPGGAGRAAAAGPAESRQHTLGMAASMRDQALAAGQAA